MTASVNVVNSPIRVTVSASGTAVTVAATGPSPPSGFLTISSGTLDGGLFNTTSFNQITDLFIDGSTFDGGTP